MYRFFRLCGDKENPLFLAKDVAEWIEHSNGRMMLKNIDEEEKVCVNNPYALQGQQEQWFLTEDGFYEVLLSLPRITDYILTDNVGYKF